MLIAFALGAVGSACLVAERLSGGDTTLALSLELAVLAVTVLVVGLLRPVARAAAATRPPRVALLVTGQIAAVLAGAALTHVMVALARPSTELRETPTQFVNDAALGIGLVLLVWSVIGKGQKLRMAMAIAALILTGVYRATASFWHVDAIAFPVLTIQQFVTFQIIAVAAGLMVLDWLSRDAEQT